MSHLPDESAPPVQPVPEESWLQQQIVRWRWAAFSLIGLIFALVYNGQWRIGNDSALYRALGHNLATGKGYTFRGELHEHAFPGLPTILAGLEHLFGPTPVPFLLLNLALAIATLVLIYRMLLSEAPRWIAVTVVTLVGFNAYFQTLTAELLTDLPFLFAACLALYGHQQLRAAHRWQTCIPPLLMLLAGLTMAAFLRPAFYILVTALAAAWFLRLITAPSRRELLTLACLVVGIAVWMSFDLRGGSELPFTGHDEQRTLRRLLNPAYLGPLALDNLFSLARENLTDIVFSLDFGAKTVNVAVAALILASNVYLLRRHRLWGILVLTTLVVTVLVIKTAPRYYLMILPFLAVGWVLMWSDIARQFPTRHDAIVGGALGLVLLTNLGMNIKLIAHQHADPFYEVYKDGEYAPALAMAQAIRAQTPPDAVILGPWARELTYLSGRNVWDGSDIDRHGTDAVADWDVNGLPLTHAIFPAAHYRERWPMVYELIATGHLSPATPPPSRNRPWWLAPTQWTGTSHPEATAAAAAPAARHP